DQLAGVLGHEIGHVIAQHAGERIERINFGKECRCCRDRHG
ncbi:MAG: M48 family metalloprotease, partial [Saprospiraceae bacterium]|nr:M48 family metalloprotease [Candidatus Vicinibacter affinis]